ncbi:MAG: hypothetical protein ABR564_01720 [Candidatus Dormibacteria bacterium]
MSVAAPGALQPRVDRAQLGAYARPGGLIVYVAVFLYVDSRLQSIAVQAAMGVMTFGVLVLCGMAMAPRERRQLCLLILFATGLELVSSQLWGVYRYRFGNVPFYIPPGHGIVFVLSLWLARTPLLHTSQQRAKRLVLIGSGVWALAGISVLPPLTGRLDMEGALLWPIFAFFILRTERALFFAAVFLVTSAVELYGVALGDWVWTPVAPYLRTPGGNPPSVIAGAYCVLDASVFGVLVVMPALARRRVRRALHGAEVPVEVPPVTSTVE